MRGQRSCDSLKDNSLEGCFLNWGSEVVVDNSLEGFFLNWGSEVVAEYWKRHVAQARSRGITICSFRMMKIWQGWIPFS